MDPHCNKASSSTPTNSNHKNLHPPTNVSNRGTRFLVTTGAAMAESQRHHLPSRRIFLSNPAESAKKPTDWKGSTGEETKGRRSQLPGDSEESRQLGLSIETGRRAPERSWLSSNWESTTGRCGGARPAQIERVEGLRRRQPGTGMGEPGARGR